LAVLLEDPQMGRYGLDLMRAAGQSSGTLYPILARLLVAGWVRADWEDVDPAVSGRPARRYYLLTAEGEVVARAELAALRERLRPRGMRPPREAGATTFTPVSGW
jgi:DNA-binding PadR family transcriptional regulator